MDKTTKNHFTAAIIAVITMGLAAVGASAGGFLDVDFAPGNFGASTIINNDYWPLAPGGAATTFIYLGDTEDGCVFDKVESDPALVKTFTESPYDSVTPMVVVDREWELEMDCDEVLVELDIDESWEPDAEDLGELTHDWYAQDGFKNIWYMGEASRDFGEVDIEGEEVECPSLDDLSVLLGMDRNNWSSEELFLECTAGSWEAGQPGQEEGEIIGAPGIVVPSDTPFGDETGDPLSPGNFWMQEVAENAEDMAKILRMSAQLSVEDRDYEICRKVKEWNPFEPGESVEHKWYCKDGPGLVLIEGIGGGPTEIEVLVLPTP